MEKERIITGGAGDRVQFKIGLTLVDSPALDSPLMTERIFGLILPVITYDDFMELSRDHKEPGETARPLFIHQG